MSEINSWIQFQIITLYNRKTDLFKGHVHTVNVEKNEDGVFIVHNSRGSTFEGNSLWNVITHMGGQDDAPICNIGISKPKESESGEETK